MTLNGGDEIWRAEGTELGTIVPQNGMCGGSLMDLHAPLWVIREGMTTPACLPVRWGDQYSTWFCQCWVLAEPLLYAGMCRWLGCYLPAVGSE